MLTKELGNVSGGVVAQWRDYYVLTKPGVVQLLVFTAIVGMFLATPGFVPWNVLVAASFGIGLAAAAGAVVNQVLDQRIDAQMARTRNRPLPQGRIGERDALAFAMGLGLAGLTVLVLFVNALTAALTFASLIGYAVVYTVFLKRATPQNIVIGGAAGATPPVRGWGAVTNSVAPHTLLLGGGFLYYALKLKFAPDPDSPMTTFRYSISYLMALFSFLLIDHYIPAIWPQ